MRCVTLPSQVHPGEKNKKPTNLLLGVPLQWVRLPSTGKKGRGEGRGSVNTSSRIIMCGNWDRLGKMNHFNLA